MDHVMSNFGNINNKTELEMKVSLLEKENFELRDQLINKLLIIKELKTDSKSNPSPTHISTTTNTITKPAQTNDNINSNNNNKNNNNNNNNNSNCKSKNNDNNNKNKTDNNSTNEKAVYSQKLQVQLEEIRKEKHTIFLNLKAYEEQADLADLSQINKSNEYINSAQINSKAVDVKWPKGTVAIVGDSIMSGIREELLKTDKHNVKVRFFRGGTIEDMEDNIKPVLKREPDYIILHVGTNNATNSTARDILDKLLQLKSKIINARKSCKVIISQPTLRSDDQKSAEVFNNYFNSIVEKLNIQIDQNLLNDASLFDDPIIAAIHKYKRHPSILKIKEQLKKDDLFSFYHVNPDKMLKIIENIDSKKATQHGDIPVRIIKENKFIFSKVLSEIFNFHIDSNTFPNGLKKADIIPIYKKDDPFDKTNYRPISILPVLSKPFERCLYDQIYEYIDTILSKVQCGFRKGFSTQYSLIAMIEKWRKNMDKGKSCAALLTDLSKAFDCIVHDFLIAKLEAYGFSYEALKVIYNYLTDRKHRTKVNNSFSDFIDLLLGVPQGSILGPLLFNIYICDLFFFVEEDNVTSYADDTTPYSNGKNVVTVLENIETKGKEVFNWFSMNYLKANPGKSHLLLTSRDEASIKIDDTDIKSSSSKKLLGVIIDNKLTFNEHVSKLCKRASNKLHALARISKYMTKDKLRTVMNAFFTSQFAYCPLIWMFHNRTLDNRINKLQERALRLVHNDNTSSFCELLQKDNSFTIHHRNIQKLALEMHRVKHRIAPKIICELFNEANVPYNLRQDVSFRSYNVKTVLYGTETLSYLGPKIWNLVPSNIRDCATEPIFRKKIKKWKPDRCPCRPCKVFISNLGFID